MKLFYLFRPEGNYYSESFAVMAASPHEAADAVNAYFAEMRSKPYEERGDSNWDVKWEADDFKSAEAGEVLSL